MCFLFWIHVFPVFTSFYVLYIPLDIYTSVLIVSSIIYIFFISILPKVKSLHYILIWMISYLPFLFCLHLLRKCYFC